MATYDGANVSAEVWRLVQEHRGRKELWKAATPAMDPKLTPKAKRDASPDN